LAAGRLLQRRLNLLDWSEEGQLLRPPRVPPMLRRPVASTPRTVGIALDVAMHMRRRDRGRGDSRGLEACQAITQSVGSIAGVVQIR
jgi:hypothetical protein